MAEPNQTPQNPKKRKKKKPDSEPEKPSHESTAPKPERCKVVVGSMPYSTTEEEIRALFDGVGEVQMSKFPDSGNFNGLAFLTFKNEEDALKSLEHNGAKMGHRNIKVEKFRSDLQKKRRTDSTEDLKKAEDPKTVEKPKKVKEPKTNKVETTEAVNEPEVIVVCYTAYIGNLPKKVTEDDIRGLFCSSKITTVRLAINKKTGKFRGFGHVDFEDEKSLEKAIKKNQVEFQGKPIKVGRASSNKINSTST